MQLEPSTRPKHRIFSKHKKSFYNITTFVTMMMMTCLGILQRFPTKIFNQEKLRSAICVLKSYIQIGSLLKIIFRFVAVLTIKTKRDKS